MASSAIASSAVLILAGLAAAGAVAQTGQPKPAVDLNCCYGQKPKCESYCPIMVIGACGGAGTVVPSAPASVSSRAGSAGVLLSPNAGASAGRAC